MGDSVVDIKKFEDKKWKDKAICIIYDDLMQEKHLHNEIIKTVLRCRKMGGGISFFFLAQSFHGGIPKSVRLNLNYLILKKVSQKDIAEILRTYQVNKTLDEMKHIYDMCTEQKFDFLLIDQEAEPEEQLKKNFTEIIE